MHIYKCNGVLFKCLPQVNNISSGTCSWHRLDCQAHKHKTKNEKTKVRPQFGISLCLSYITFFLCSDKRELGIKKKEKTKTKQQSAGHKRYMPKQMEGHPPNTKTYKKRQQERAQRAQENLRRGAGKLQHTQQLVRQAAERQLRSTRRVR